MDLKNRKVLLVGLGMLGGGEETAKFLVKKGGKLTITDLRKREILETTIKKLPPKINFVFGRHRKLDFKNNEVVVFNQAIPASSPWVKLAKDLKKTIKSDLTLFLEGIENRKLQPEYIAITGTRGKTTISTWINYFLEDSVLGGNIPSKGLIRILKNKTKLFVLELSSFQLEYMEKGLKAPKIAIITNLYNDHLNRYGTLPKYLKEKSKIFLNQNEDDFLVLNTDDTQTSNFLKMKPKARIYYFSLKKLAKNKNGLFFVGPKIYFQENGKKKLVYSVYGLEEFQKMNLLAALLGAYLYTRNWDELTSKISTLPSVPFRQEVIFENKDLKIINDSVATSPDAAITAIERFSKEIGAMALITGGTDKKLEFSGLAGKIKKHIKLQNLFLLEGTATIKLVKELNKNGYFKGAEVNTFSDLGSILKSVKKQKNNFNTILFSPASASFEKFNNEMDRGNKFNKLVKGLKFDGK